MLALTLLVSLVSFITRQHYGLHNQNRIIRLEMRLRYHILTGRRFELVEVKLQPKQIFALRYASDEELPGLVDRAINEKLSPSQIRDSIVHWKADDMRV